MTQNLFVSHHGGGTGIKAKCPHGLCQTKLNLLVCVCVCLYLFNKPISLLWPRVELVGEAYKFIQCKITKGPGGSLPGYGELNPQHSLPHRSSTKMTLWRFYSLVLKNVIFKLEAL